MSKLSRFFSNYPITTDNNDYRLAFAVLASTWCKIFNMDMSISPLFMQIQHQVEANPTEMNLLSL